MQWLFVLALAAVSGTASGGGVVTETQATAPPSP